MKTAGGVQAQLLGKSQEARKKVDKNIYIYTINKFTHAPSDTSYLGFFIYRHILSDSSNCDFRIPNCDQIVLLEPANNDSFLILQNGSLYHEV